MQREPPPNTPTNLTDTSAMPTCPRIGREQELGELRELVLSDDIRLVTLWGPGGIGKSRLALELAAQLGERFEAGVGFVDLSPVHDPGQVARQIAHALGLDDSAGKPTEAVLKEYLRPQRLLLVLDNFEQVAEAAPVLADLLSAAAGLKVIVTSRTVLRLSAEHAYPVPALSLPVAGTSMSPEQLLEYGAIRLFVERARAVKPDFTLQPANGEAVAELCRRLDGLPLAIELAAARVRLLPPRALLSRLGSQLESLSSGPRDLPARQQTLRTTIAWSYNLLADERQLFRQMGVFAGGADLPAIEAVSADCGEVLEALELLVNHSLVTQVEGVEGDEEPRFTMLEAIREYSAERLRESVDYDAVRDRHASYYLTLAETAGPEIRGAGQVSWLGRLERERGNLRVAMDRLVERGDIEASVRLAWALWLFWWIRGDQGHASLWFERLGERLSELPHASRARALAVIGAMFIRRGEYQRAEPFLVDAAGLFDELGDEAGKALALLGSGLVALARGDLEQTLRYLEESLTLFRKGGDTWGMATVLGTLGMVEETRGGGGRSIGLMREAMAIQQALGNTNSVADSLHALAVAAQRRGNYDEALPLLEEGLRLGQQAGNRRIIAHCLDGFAREAAARGEPERAAQLWGAAEAIHEGEGVPLSHMDPKLYPEVIPSVRARSDEGKWAAAWQRGRSMTIDEAVAYALDAPDRATVATTN